MFSNKTKYILSLKIQKPFVIRTMIGFVDVVNGIA